MKHLAFWLNTLSFHQSFLITELSKKYKVSVIYEEKISLARQKEGWTLPSFGNAELIPIDHDRVKEISDDESIQNHVFIGICTYKKTSIYFKKLLSIRRCHVFSEIPDPRGVKGKLRLIKYKYLSYRFASKISSLLTPSGKEYFERLGFHNCFEFGYYLNQIESKLRLVDKNTITKLIFIGRASKDKGIYDLLDSLVSIEKPYHLDIYGLDCCSPNNINHEIEARNLSARVTFHGVVDNNELRLKLFHYDCLVLPTKYDGWGAVVSEALMSGVRVLVSENAGVSKYIMKHDVHGAVVYQENALGKNMRDVLQTLPLSAKERGEIYDSSFCLNAKFGSQLLSSIIDF